jgi:ubiquinone/menaquinone biosynthesis C-methylase UbiE
VKNATIEDVRKVYGGPEGKLWELIMGEQIHVGGWRSSMELAKIAGVGKGMRVLDICSAIGTGLRFLVKNFGVEGCGLDATMHMVRESRKRIKKEKLQNSIKIKHGEASEIPWKDGFFDLVWGEDAWCYVSNKKRMLAEAARVLKKKGRIAFTDWTDGKKGLGAADVSRIKSFMKFPNIASKRQYETMLSDEGFKLIHSEEDSADFARHIKLYIDMLSGQLMFDALKIIGEDMEHFKAMGNEMGFMLEMAEKGKFSRTRIVAEKKD